MATKKRTRRKTSKRRASKRPTAKSRKGDVPKLPEPHVTPVGVSGLKRTDRHVYDEWHPKLQGTRAIEVYREMSDNDPVIGSFLYVLKQSVLGAEVTIGAADETPLAQQIADHVTSCLDDMTMTLNEFLSDVVSMAWAGFSWHEVINKVRRGDHLLGELRSKYDDGLVGWRKMPIRAQDTIDEWIFDDDGSVIAAVQQAPPDFGLEKIPIEHSLLFRAGYNKGSPEGRSLLRNAYTSYYFVRRIRELEAIGVSRDMAGILVFQLPIDYFGENLTADQQTTIDNYRKVAERARRGEYESLVFPAENDPDGATGWKASLMQSGGRRPIDTNEIIKRLESRIAISVLGEAVLLGMQGNVGSWALASEKTHMLGMGIRGIMQSISDVMTRFAIPRLVKLNYWPTELSPEWKFGDVETDAATELVNSLVAAVGAGIMTPDEQIEDYLRSRMGLPESEDLDLTNGATQDALGRMSEQPDEGMAPEAALQGVVPIEEQQNTPTAAMTVDEAAEQLGVSRAVIMRAIARGALPGAKVGGTYRIMREDLNEYMRGMRAA
jgi:excisionase family DNA binding protein